MNWGLIWDALKRGYVTFPYGDGYIGIHAAWFAAVALPLIFVIALFVWLMSSNRRNENP